MVHPEIIIVPATFGIPAAVVLAFRWFRHKEQMATLAPGRDHTAGVEARLERMEQVMDAMAVEIERIGEGQRFVTKLLAERNAPLAEPAAPSALPRGRVNTPH
jgi:hypothetical protein